ncbi:MAG: hypothetical protein Ct9H90mP20_7360 [Candidatus Neomarinimicrobiota bacterium]|nr:MAG: hypothetical protein Ct9H90mP20_7360 [Candidatus Neomarinimicrobiota bacterium]
MPFSNLLDQRFSNAFYRSSWKAEPAVIELYLNSSVLLPKSDVSIFFRQLQHSEAGLL